MSIKWYNAYQMLTTKKHCLVFVFVILLYLKEQFQGYTETKGLYCFKNAHFVSDMFWILMKLMELGVNKKCLLWFLYNYVCGVGGEGVRRRSERRKRRGKEDKGVLKVWENSLCGTRLQGILEFSGKNSSVEKAKEYMSEDPPTNSENHPICFW